MTVEELFDMPRISLAIASAIAIVALAACGGGGQKSTASDCRPTSPADAVARRLIVESVPGFEETGPPSPSSGDSDDGVKAGSSGGLETGVERGFDQGPDKPLLIVNALCYRTPADANAVYKSEVQLGSEGVTSATEVVKDLPGTVLVPVPDADGGTAVIQHKNVIVLVQLFGGQSASQADATIRATARAEIELLNRSV